MKLNKQTAGALIFAALALLLFFSKTMYNYNLPEVSGVKPSRGGLSKLEISSGIAGWAETENIYAAVGGIAGQVFVKEGDRVEKGQPLFQMDFDIAAAERKLAETRNNIAKLENDIRNTQIRLDILKQVLAAAEEVAIPNDTPLPPGEEHPTEGSIAFIPVDVPGQAGVIVLEINKARSAMENARFSHELGSLSRSEALTAENNFKALIFRYGAEADDLEYSLNAKRIDLRNLRLTEEACREVLGDYRNNAVAIAPAAGIVETLNAQRGKFFAENNLLASIGVGREFTVECSVSLDNNFIASGDVCELNNSSHVLRGTVSRIRPSAQGKTVLVSVVSDEVSAGETFEVTFEKNSAASFTLVPNAAINQDSDGYFLYQIKRRKGIMGEEYYVDRLDVFVGDSDYKNTAIVRGITFFEPVVLSSNKPLSVGLTVSLKNPGDFFEN